MNPLTVKDLEVNKKYYSAFFGCILKHLGPDDFMSSLHVFEKEDGTKLYLPSGMVFETKS